MSGEAGSSSGTSATLLYTDEDSDNNMVPYRGGMASVGILRQWARRDQRLNEIFTKYEVSSRIEASEKIIDVWGDERTQSKVLILENDFEFVVPFYKDEFPNLLDKAYEKRLTNAVIALRQHKWPITLSFLRKYAENDGYPDSSGIRDQRLDFAMFMGHNQPSDPTATRDSNYDHLSYRSGVAIAAVYDNQPLFDYLLNDVFRLPNINYWHKQFIRWIERGWLTKEETERFVRFLVTKTDFDINRNNLLHHVINKELSNDLVGVFLEKGAKFDVFPSRSSLLYRAPAYFGLFSQYMSERPVDGPRTFDLLRRILQSGVDLSLFNKQGAPILDIVTYYRQDERLVRMLIAYGANIQDAIIAISFRGLSRDKPRLEFLKRQRDRLTLVQRLSDIVTYRGTDEDRAFLDEHPLLEYSRIRAKTSPEQFNEVFERAAEIQSRRALFTENDDNEPTQVIDDEEVRTSPAENRKRTSQQRSPQSEASSSSVTAHGEDRDAKRQRDQIRAIFIACKKGDQRAVSTLLSDNSRLVNARLRDGTTLSDYAARNNQHHLLPLFSK